MAWCGEHDEPFGECFEQHLPTDDTGLNPCEEVALLSSMERHPAFQHEDVPLPPELERLVDQAIERMEHEANQRRTHFTVWLANISDEEFHRVVEMVHNEYQRRLDEG
jgi:hypothetical protein